MQTRFAQILFAELLAFWSFVLGGLAVLGGSMTRSGHSRHPVTLSWSLVAAFALLALFLARAATSRLRLAFAARSEAS
ncbi:MAG: hypothetical protein AAGA20_15185 [Planctomycetota bacterium]